MMAAATIRPIVFGELQAQVVPPRLVKRTTALNPAARSPAPR